MTSRYLLFSLAVTALAVGACAGNNKQNQRPAAASDTGFVGGISLGSSSAQSATKVIVTSFEFTAAGVTPRGALAGFGQNSDPPRGGSAYRIELTDNADQVLAGYSIADPRVIVVEMQGMHEMPRALYAARFAFHYNASAARVLDAQGHVMASQDVKAAVQQLCARLRADKDCLQVVR